MPSPALPLSTQSAGIPMQSLLLLLVVCRLVLCHEEYSQWMQIKTGGGPSNP